VYGEDPWRPAYGNLNKFRALLPHSVSVSALTATANPYMEGVIKTKLTLHSNLVKILDPLNWLNITYATLDMVDSPSNFNNFNILIPADFNMQMTLKPTLVFSTSKTWLAMSQDTSIYILDLNIKAMVLLSTTTVVYQQNTFNRHMIASPQI
jgi:superfamily II DNA helicase RecQ